jgi:hypothetical protein
MHGLTKPMEVREWYLQELPAFRALAAKNHRARLWAFKRMHSLAQRMRPFLPGAWAATRISSWFRRMVARRLSVQVCPEQLFGDSSCPVSGTVDRLFLAVSHDASDIRVQPIATAEFIHRMALSLEAERHDLESHYMKFRFAFPDLANPVLEQAHEIERELLARALAGKPAWVVYHPSPLPISALFDVLSPLVSGSGIAQ